MKDKYQEMLVFIKVNNVGKYLCETKHELGINYIFKN